MQKSINLIFLFILLLFVSKNNGLALLISLTIINALYDKQNFIALCIMSVFLDIYNLSFVGMSFIYIFLVTFIIKNYLEKLQNLSLEIICYYLFMMLYFLEIVIYFFTICFDGNFNCYEHVLLPIKTLIFYLIIEMIKRFYRVKG